MVVIHLQKIEKEHLGVISILISDICAVQWISSPGGKCNNFWIVLNAVPLAKTLMKYSIEYSFPIIILIV